MYPYEIIWGLTLYEIFLTAGVLASMIVFRVLSDKTKLDAGLFNFCLGSGVAAIIGGYGSSVLFQAFYNYRETGVFEITKNTGATFYGGLIGGAGIFLISYFAIGSLAFRGGIVQREFYHVAGIAAPSITAAHSLGRIGCLMAGCCHGIASDTFGVYMVSVGKKVLPVQLYESLFLVALTVWFIVRILKGKRYNFPLYMTSYGIWRYFIEYLRGDDRGATLVDFLSPSQLTALVLIAGGIVFWYFEKKHNQRADVKK
jgi:phosphatidylglycerol:prolipoprotein diacylglycerol transferase